MKNHFQAPTPEQWTRLAFRVSLRTQKQAEEKSLGKISASVHRNFGQCDYADEFMEKIKFFSLLDRGAIP
jgi:hypothetical protein